MTQETVIADKGTVFLVKHRTDFLYGDPVISSANTLHLEPHDFRFQKNLSAFVKVLPATNLKRFEDLFGNITHHFEVTAPHTRLEIESSVKVRNLPLKISNTGYSGGMEFFNAPEIQERCWQFLHESRWVSVEQYLWKQAIDLTLDIDPVFEKTSAIMRWIYTEFTYEPGSTDVNTHLEQAFNGRKGVCQDFAHIMIGMCRALGIPARYTSGYIYTGEGNDLVGSQASHAWCEVYLPEDGWVGFDPTNAVLADDRYIKIAVGRDYEDVAPIRGTYRGSADCKMEVTVNVKRLETP
ncbi:transglutaminase family protein [Luteolibacter sp. AS25]|uniref:transglutaminase family protein n=1 Tax=Luteolibacter sp. AS25 TaxID=3135776 RepID=UPI00398ABC7C